MVKRYARLYSDGSFGVDSGDANDLAMAKHRLGISSDDDDTELVEVDIKVIATHGKPKLKIVVERIVECPCCKEIINIEDTQQQSNEGGLDRAPQ